MNQKSVVAGMDVGKENLDVHIAPRDEAETIRNDADGRRGVRNWPRKAGIKRIVIEATGRYHRDLHTAAFTATASTWR